jgi:hypothetical protein
MSVHPIEAPIAYIHSFIDPRVPAMPMDVVLMEVAHVGASVGPRECALALFFAIAISTSVKRAIPPLLLPVSILLIVLPLAYILCPTVRYVFA